MKIYYKGDSRLRVTKTNLIKKEANKLLSSRDFQLLQRLLQHKLYGYVDRSTIASVLNLSISRVASFLRILQHHSIITVKYGYQKQMYLQVQGLQKSNLTTVCVESQSSKLLKSNKWLHWTLNQTAVNVEDLSFLLSKGTKKLSSIINIYRYMNRCNNIYSYKYLNNKLAQVIRYLKNTSYKDRNELFRLGNEGLDLSCVTQKEKHYYEMLIRKLCFNKPTKATKEQLISFLYLLNTHVYKHHFNKSVFILTSNSSILRAVKGVLRNNNTNYKAYLSAINREQVEEINELLVYYNNNKQV